MKLMLFDGSACPFCGAVVGAPGFVAHSTYVWANQYGYSKRIFCRKCNRWTDYEDKSDVIVCVRWRDEKGDWHKPASDGCIDIQV